MARRPLGSGLEKGTDDCSPPKVDRIWAIWGSYHNIPKAIFYLLKGDYTSLQELPKGEYFCKLQKVLECHVAVIWAVFVFEQHHVRLVSHKWP